MIMWGFMSPLIFTFTFRLQLTTYGVKQSGERIHCSGQLFVGNLYRLATELTYTYQGMQ